MGGESHGGKKKPSKLQEEAQSRVKALEEEVGALRRSLAAHEVSTHDFGMQVKERDATIARLEKSKAELYERFTRREKAIQDHRPMVAEVSLKLLELKYEYLASGLWCGFRGLLNTQPR